MTLMIAVLLITLGLVENISGHGMMLDPPNRSSLWRFNSSFPIYLDDDEHYCGGTEAQYDKNGGKCGPCGDNYSDKVPRINENTGKYGLGYVSASYPSGSAINVKILLTVNHKGSFTYSLCKLNDVTKPEDESCFKELLFADGSEKYELQSGISDVINVVQLPKNFVCERCVLRWHYTAAHLYGTCENGETAQGCGNQQNFRSCADISIY